MALQSSRPLANRKSQLHTSPHAYPQVTDSRGISMKSQRTFNQIHSMHISSVPPQSLDHNDPTYFSPGLLRHVNDKGLTPCSSGSIPSRSSARYSSPLSSSHTNTSPAPSYLCGISTNRTKTSEGFQLWSKLLECYSPPVKASNSNFHREQQTTSDLPLTQDIPLTDDNEFAALWQLVMATYASASQPPIPRPLSYVQTCTMLNIIEIPVYPSFANWLETQKIEETLQFETGGGPRLYCWTGQDFAEQLSSRVNKYLKEGRTYPELVDLLKDTLFLPGNTSFEEGSTGQAEVRSRLHVTSESIEMRNDMLKQFLLPPFVQKTLPSINSKPRFNIDGSTSNDTYSLTNRTKVVQQHRLLENPPRRPISASDTGSHCPASLPPSSRPISWSSTSVDDDNSLSFPDGTYDLSYWLDTTDDLFEQKTIPCQTFVLPSNHTSPYLTVVFPETRPSGKLMMEECTRFLYFKLAIKGSAALFTRYKLRELAMTRTLIPTRTQSTNSTADEAPQTQCINLEGIEHFGITVNAVGGFRAFRLSPIVKKRQSIDSPWGGVHMQEMLQGVLTLEDNVARLRDFINIAHYKAGKDGEYLRGLLSDLRASKS